MRSLTMPHRNDTSGHGQRAPRWLFRTLLIATVGLGMFACVRVIASLSFGDPSPRKLGEQDFEYVDAIMRDFNSTVQGFDEASGRCVARMTLSVVGSAALRSAGVTPANIPGFGHPESPLLGEYRLTDDQTETIGNGLSKCMGLVEVAIGWFPGLPPIDGEAKSCAEVELRGNRTFEAGMVYLIFGTGTDVSNGFPVIFVTSALEKCGLELPTPSL